ncbi:MAG: hypothetical protein Q8O37_09375 [Sulfuricellaceae bacterium]|nr:hypothetical protein [Sulfuricellaceae bacterium]
MQAIEFEAVIRERSIPLPATMTLSIGQAVRVVVMYEDLHLQAGPARTDDAISRLAANPLVTPDFVPLSRDEAHER